jgi:hypothetical protein
VAPSVSPASGRANRPRKRYRRARFRGARERAQQRDVDRYSLESDPDGRRRHVGKCIGDAQQPATGLEGQTVCHCATRPVASHPVNGNPDVRASFPGRTWRSCCNRNATDGRRLAHPETGPRGAATWLGWSVPRGGQGPIPRICQRDTSAPQRYSYIVRCTRIDVEDAGLGGRGVSREHINGVVC